MADKKTKDDAPETDATPKTKSLSVYNVGQRNIKLKDGLNGAKRNLPPGASIEAADQAEYDTLMRYKDVVDSLKMVPNVGEKIDKLEKEKAALLAEKNTLEAEVLELRKKLDDKKGK